ncbi:hypothetical protein [Halorubrum sp. CSM-61]|uniref:hypothetical protein n=1 Tax=Halorubrum sp. CSM-61 TaxID=2485838 RepID=UPI000F4AFE37|nr:hypothetical protein [Halorubrum sp. CSM-61]
MRPLYVIGLGLIGLVMLPALLAGGGFIVAILLVVAIAAIFFGGPAAYDLYKTKNLGANGGMQARDLIAGRGDGDTSDFEREDN